MERTIITWNVPNWITIVLMAATGYLIFGLLSQLVLGQLSSGGSASGASSVSGAAPAASGY